MINKVFFNIVFAIIFACVVYLCVTNVKAEATCQFCADLSGNMAIVGTFAVILGCYFVGVISGMAASFGISGKYKEQLEFYARKSEKLAQQNEIDTDDKEALQRKIATLEIALQNALKNK